MTGSLFAAPVYRTYGELIVEQRFKPLGFAMPLGLEDFRSVLAGAEAERVPIRQQAQCAIILSVAHAYRASAGGYAPLIFERWRRDPSGNPPMPRKLSRACC